jgi:hypothetical protein
MRLTAQIILEKDNNYVPYCTLEPNDRIEVFNWANDRLSEMREEIGGTTDSFRKLVKSIEIDEDQVYFDMKDMSALVYDGLEAEISDGYMNDCSLEEIDLSIGTCRIFFISHKVRRS